MTESQGKQLIFELVDSLIKNNFNISKSNLGIIEFIEQNGICGATVFVDTEAYKLSINKRLLKDGKLDYLRCVVYHELAHIIQYNEAISHGLIRYNKAEDCIDILCKDAAIADNLVFDNFHHTIF